MVNRIADRILSAVLPQEKAAAPCGAYYYQRCYCSAGKVYYRRCQDCTTGGGCGYCSIVLTYC